jgi:hypothetical protein
VRCSLKERLEADGVDVVRAAAALGLRVLPGGTATPCPVCGADRRGSEDRRGPLGFGPLSWRCWRGACGAKGDVADLVRAVSASHGGPASGADGWAAAEALAVDVGLVAPDGLLERPGGGGVSVVRPVVPVAPVAVPARVRVVLPPAGEVAELWTAAGRVDTDPGVAAWLRSRALSPEVVAELDLARALPPAGKLPGWARIERLTWRSGWRCVLPATGADGELVALRARWAAAADAPPVGAKEIGGRGVAAGPAVFADPVGRWLLAHGPDARPGELVGGPHGWRWSGVVVVCEGGPDWLTLATATARMVSGRSTAAILGMWSGGWTREIGARVPPGCVVRLMLHGDTAGQGYADKVRSTLPAGCRVEVLR